MAAGCAPRNQRYSGAVWRRATTPGEVVGKTREQASLASQRFDIRGRLGDNNDLPAVRAATLNYRDAALCRHLDDRTKLVQQERPGAPACWATS